MSGVRTAKNSPKAPVTGALEGSSVALYRRYTKANLTRGFQVNASDL